MNKTLLIAAFFLVVNATLVIAHHPAADMVDAEIYAMIDDLVSDTPHAELDFDVVMGDGDDTTIINTDTVAAADDLIDDGLLDDLSFLDGDVSITIDFPDEDEVLLQSVEELNQKVVDGQVVSGWQRPVTITIKHTYEVD